MGSYVQRTVRRRRRFWADSRPNGGGYHQWYPGRSWSFDTWYQAHIEATDTTLCTWWVFLGGYTEGQSTSNCVGGTNTRSPQAGIESVDQSPEMKGWQTAWQQAGNDWNWTDGWGESPWWTPPSIGRNDNPPNINCTNPSTPNPPPNFGYDYCEEWFNESE